MEQQLSSILKRIERKATIFTTGGFRPENTLTESWIGRVFAYREEEEIPTDEEGYLMLPLLQVYLPALPFVPAPFKDTKLITVFISARLPGYFEESGRNWVIREYKSEDEVVIKDLRNPDSHLKPFPLKPSAVTNDCPLWDGGGLDRETEDEIVALERSGVIENYFDFTKHHYETKLGGYPSFCQPGVDFGEGFEFVFQVSTDGKANLNVVDNGSLMFSKNSETGVWQVYYDFY